MSVSQMSDRCDFELNSSDNTVVFDDGDNHFRRQFPWGGQPLALTLDYADIALFARLPVFSERRTYLLTGHATMA